MATKKTKKISASQKVGIGVGLTTAAVAAAGAYFLYGSPNAKKNRKKVKSWTLKAKAEVLEALEEAQDITQEEYEALVEAIGGAYSSVKTATKGEVADFKKEMKDHWKKIEKTAPARKIQREAKKAVKRVTKKPAKKTARKAAKKTAKKATKKTAKKATKKAAKKRK